MNHEYAIPPLRELPPARLGRRSAHLRAEIAREQPSSRLLTPRRSLVLAALVLALGAVLWQRRHSAFGISSFAS